MKENKTMMALLAVAVILGTLGQSNAQTALDLFQQAQALENEGCTITYVPSCLLPVRLSPSSLSYGFVGTLEREAISSAIGGSECFAAGVGQDADSMGAGTLGGRCTVGVIVGCSSASAP
jgi:hypothetical protein